MNNNKSKLIITATIIGAMVGLGIGAVLAETKKEQLLLADKFGEDDVMARAGLREWFTVAIAAITLIRKLSDTLTPKV